MGWRWQPHCHCHVSPEKHSIVPYQDDPGAETSKIQALNLMSVTEAPPTFQSRPIQRKRRYFSKSIFSQATAAAAATRWKRGDVTVRTADSINRIFWTCYVVCYTLWLIHSNRTEPQLTSCIDWCRTQGDNPTFVTYQPRDLPDLRGSGDGRRQRVPGQARASQCRGSITKGRTRSHSLAHHHVAMG